MNGLALDFREVRVRHDPGGPAVLDGVTFSMLPGERVALVGLNGSGKTTLLLAAVGLVAHEGELWVAGERLTSKTLSRVRDRVGFLFNVPEDQLLLPTVLDDIAFGLARRGLPAGEAAAKAALAAEALGISQLTRLPVHRLSHGQKQRVALAGALVTEPPLLLLDEPSAALDPPGKRALATVLKGQTAAMLIATHDLDFAAQLCSRFLVLDRGRLVDDGPEVNAVRRRWEP